MSFMRKSTMIGAIILFSVTGIADSGISLLRKFTLLCGIILLSFSVIGAGDN